MKVAFSFFRKPLLYDCDFKDIKHLTLTRVDNQIILIFLYSNYFKPFPNDRISDMTKLKALADDKLNVA